MQPYIPIKANRCKESDCSFKILSNFFSSFLLRYNNQEWWTWSENFLFADQLNLGGESNQVNLGYVTFCIFESYHANSLETFNVFFFLLLFNTRVVGKNYLCYL